jgi:hypothetical protein
MAVLVVTQPTAAELLNKNKIAITLSEWATDNEPVVTIGSVFDVGGAMFEVQGADDDIDVASAFGGLATGLVYIYYPATGIAYVSSTAPTWSDLHQEWMDAGETACCIGSMNKTGAGVYSQKTIFIDREHAIIYQGVNLGIGANADRVLRLATDASILWDESKDAVIFDKTLGFASGVAGSHAFTTLNETWVIPAGCYLMCMGTTLFFQFGAGVWAGIGPLSGFMYSDGVNYRLKNGFNGANLAAYVKLN